MKERLAQRRYVPLPVAEARPDAELIEISRRAGSPFRAALRGWISAEEFLRCDSLDYDFSPPVKGEKRPSRKRKHLIEDSESGSLGPRYI